MLMRFDPFRELDRLTGGIGNGNGNGGRSGPQILPMDAYRRGDHFIVNFDLPGADADSIDLQVEKNVVTVRAERTWSRQEGDEVLVAERPQGGFTRQLFLGESLDVDNIQATYENGVLTLHIPVAEQAKPRKVSVTSGTGSAKAVDATSSAS